MSAPVIISIAAAATRSDTPRMFSSTWTNQVPVAVATIVKPTDHLDRFIASSNWGSPCEMLASYVVGAPEELNMSQLVQAELLYLYFNGPECPFFYDAMKDICWV